MPPDAKAEISPRMVAIARGSLLALVVAVLLLVFAVPRWEPPPATLADPDEAFIDRAGLVSPDFARQWAGGLLNDDRAQIVIYVDRKPPEGELAEWAIRTATEWKIGAAREDTGLVLFVFTEPRLARIDVGYGLEARLTDARVRQLLETHLAPAFAQREYEKGFDALLFAIREEIGGNDAASIHARAAAARERDDVPWFAQAIPALQRTPRVVAAVFREYMESDASPRLAILVASGVVLAIVAFGVAVAGNTLWRLATLPAAIRVRKASGGPAAIGVSVFEIVMGAGMFLVCLTLVMFVLLAADSLFTRKGTFSGAGAAIVWPAP
jgi:uncharacterized membrane protein YgcG